MEDKRGKGNITLDDIAKGISYNNDPYLDGDKFAIVTPDPGSQKKFYGTQNYTHKYLEKEKRSPFVEYRTKIQPVEGYNTNQEEARVQAQNPKVESYKTAQPESALAPAQTMQPAPTQPLVSKKEAKQVIPASRKNKQVFLPSKTYALLPKKVGIYHPKELYSPNKTSTQEMFSKTNPFQGYKYHNMLSALSLREDATLGDVLARSEETRRNLKTALCMQRNKAFLTSQMLPPVPKSRGEPLMVQTPLLKNVYKRIGNSAHSKVTNGGYMRTPYGGYYMS
jgi:hypothetical protein